MRLKIFLKLLIISSCLAACDGDIPPLLVSPCDLNYELKGLVCSDPKGSTTTYIPFEDADKYICMSPTDTKKVVDRLILLARELKQCQDKL